MSQNPIQDENVFNEKLIKSNGNLKTINFLEANLSLSRRLNIVQTERQQEIFNDSLESTTSDYCAENIHELENCTEKSTALNFNMISYECNVEATDKHNFPLSISYSNNESASVFQEKIIQRNPYASFNSYYDEYWKEKQESAFTNWLNFILTPNDDFKSADVKVNSAEIWVESMKTAAPLRAPSKEELSFKTYTAIKAT
ncbi:abnormal spindle-like microcephaly-associated [Caerostris extrusa]|uniref:Abnormal spindle-like microcephaly-associated n=1 Tax=Caerostris extrusa TaxID=172846 RepID=A0AAV4M9W6_CAEEX|nr:abnormal spindle-like microcephaly-associated [Caerostris extrusa]